MKYVALLRGVNVGGKSMVKMTEIKKVLEKEEFSKVSTYINSGNILFESEKKNSELTKEIEKILKDNFFEIGTVVLSDDDLKDVLQQVPQSWKQDDVRKYIGFLKDSIRAEDVIQVAELKEGIDFIDKGPHVVYMTTKMEGLTKSSFPKLISKPIYKQITIRNVNTAQKLLTLLEKNDE